MDLSYDDGETRFRGYLVDDSGGRPRPGILVFHGGAGLDAHAHTQAERYAGLGYVVLAADLYGEEAMAGGRDAILATIQRLRGHRDLLARRATAALDVLRRHASVAGPIGVVGFCFGGLSALEFARSGAPIAAAVSIHGALATTEPAVSGAIRARLLVCHGASDPHVPLEQVTAFANEMTAAGATWEVDIYGGAVHGFTHRDMVGEAARPDNAYDERADGLSFERAARFFADALSRGSA